MSTSNGGQSPKIKLQLTHSSVITAMAMSPDGKYLLTECYLDGMIKLWDLSNNRLIKDIYDNSRSENLVSIWGIDYSPDGKHFATSYRTIPPNNYVRIWDIETGKVIKEIKNNVVFGIAIYGIDGRYLLINNGIYDTQKHKIIKTFKTIQHGAINNTGDMIALSHYDPPTVDIYSFPKGKKIYSIPKITTLGEVAFTNLSFSNDGKYLLEASKSSVCVYDIKRWEELAAIPVKSENIKSAIFSNDSKHIIISAYTRKGTSKDFEFSVWDLYGKKIKTLNNLVENPGLLVDYPNKDLFVCASEPDFSNPNMNIDFISSIDFKHYSSIEDNVGLPVDYIIQDNNLTIVYQKYDHSNYYYLYRTFDLSTGKDIETRKTQNYDYINESGKIGLTQDKKDTKRINLWDTYSDQLIQSIQINKPTPINNSKFIVKNNKLLYCPSQAKTDLEVVPSELYLYDIKSGKLIKKFRETEISSYQAEHPEYNSIALFDDAKTLVRVTINGVEYVDIETEAILKTIKQKNITTMVLSPKQNHTMLISENDNIHKCSVFNSYGKEVYIKQGIEYYGGKFSPENTYMALSNSSHEILIVNISTGAEVSKIKTECLTVPMMFSEDEKFLITYSMEKEAQFWDVKTGKLVLTRLESQKFDDFLWLRPDQYYMSSRNGADLVHYVHDQKVYPFEQFDIIKNRPDKVLAVFPESDPILIEAYYKAYKKRLQKLGYSEEDLNKELHLPLTQITNRNEFPKKSLKSNLSLDIKASDNKYRLNRINVWVNDVPVFGINGISLKNKKTDKFKQSISITLSEGKNKIQVSCLNEKAVESLKETIQIVYEPAIIKKPDLYLVSIGVSQFSESDYNLTYAKKDASDLCQMMEDKKDNFAEVHEIKLFDTEATKEKILRTKKMLLESSVDDIVIIFMASHGLLDDNLDYYLATHDIQFSNPSGRGLAFEDLESLVDSIPARKKIMLIDACHSGEIDKDEELFIASSDNAENVNYRSIGTERGFKTIKSMDYKSSFELMKSLFVDLRRGTGTVIISSAGGGEFAYEGAKWNNGVFTYSVLVGLTTGKADLNNNGNIQVSELRDYVFDNVNKLTNGKQNPTTRKGNLEFDWKIW